MPKLEYPKILTNKDWQSKKALADKVGKNKKTGVGDELDKFEAAFRKTAYAKPSEGLRLLKPVTDPIRFKTELGNVRTFFTAERKKLQPAIAALKKKIDDTTKVVGASSSTGKHLTKMQTALGDFVVDMAEHVTPVERDCVKAYAAHLKEKSAAFGFVLDKGNPGRRNVAPFLDHLDQIKTFNDVDHYFNTNGLSQNPPGRALATLAQNWDQIVLADFPEYARKFYSKTATEDAWRGQKWLYELATPHTSGETTALFDLRAEKAKTGASEADLINKFKVEAKRSFAAAEEFLTAYFTLIDRMPSDLQKL